MFSQTLLRVKRMLLVTLDKDAHQTVWGTILTPAS